MTLRFRRWVAMLTGTVLLAVGVATIITSGLGTGPIDALIVGLTDRSGVSIAVLSLVVSLLFIGLAWLAGIRPSWGTAVSMLAFAPLLAFLLDVAPHDPGEAVNVAVAAVEWAVGATLIAAGSAAMIVADLGVGAYDAATLAVSKRVGLSVPKARFVLDVAVALIAFLVGGPIWFGTVALALVMPLLLAVTLPLARKAVPRRAVE